MFALHVVEQPANMTQIGPGGCSGANCFSILQNDNVSHINAEWFCKPQIDFRHHLWSPNQDIMHRKGLVSSARSVRILEILCCNTRSSFPSTLMQKQNNNRNQRRQPEAQVMKHCLAFLGIFVLFVHVWSSVYFSFLWTCAKGDTRTVKRNKNIIVTQGWFHLGLATT